MCGFVRFAHGVLEVGVVVYSLLVHQVWSLFVGWFECLNVSMNPILL